MRNVLRLVVKDMALMFRFAMLLFIAEFVLIVALAVQVEIGSSRGPLSLIVAFVGGFLICLRSTVLEEKNRAFIFIKLLPISTTEVVVAKFVTNVVAVGSNSILLFLVAGVRVSDSGIVQLDLDGSSFVLFFAAQWVCNAVFVGTALSFGSEKAIWAPFALLFVLFNVMLNIETLGLANVVAVVTADATRSFAVATLFVVATVALSTFAMRRRRVFG